MMYMFSVSDVSHESSVVTDEEPDHETLGFTDDNQSWLKPVTKKEKREQFLGSDGEEAQSDSEGSIMGEEVQSGSEGSIVGETQSGSEGNVGEEAQQDSEGSVGEEVQTDSEGSVAGEVQSGSEGSVEGEGDHQEEMSLDGDENYKVRKLLTHSIFTA
jgi:hypothetical protein